MRAALIVMMLWKAIVPEPVHRVSIDDKLIALTFDGGPRAETPRVLAELARYGARATFFVVGEQMVAHPGEAKAIVAAGHELANHSFSHPIARWWWSPPHVWREITRTDSLIRRAGAAGPIHFRSPYFERTPVLALTLLALGKRNVFADVFTRDWEKAPSGRIARYVIDRARPGSIVMLHEHDDPSLVETLRPILSSLVGAGYRFVTVSTLLARDGKCHR